MSKIFISHSSKDNEFVKKLSHDLLTHGIPVWLDVYELEIGDSLYDKIFSTIDESDLSIVVISEHYNKTIWTSKEFKSILSKEDMDGRKYLIPINIDGCKVPLEIADRIYQNFENDYKNSVNNLIRLFKKGNFSIESIPLSKRQIILNFSNNTEIDIELINSIIGDIHKHKDEKILKKQLFFNAYQDIDQLLIISKANLLALSDNNHKLNQFKKHTKDIENYINAINNGILLIFNEYKGNDYIGFISISIYWFVKMLMTTIYSIIKLYLTDQQLLDYNLSNKNYSPFPASNSLTFDQFYGVKGYARLDFIFNNKHFPIAVNEDCYAYTELEQSLTPITLRKAYSVDLLYKYLIPQNVLAKVFDNEKVILITDFENCLIGLA